MTRTGYAIAAAWGFEVVLVITLLVALETRDFEELEATLPATFATGLGVLGAWVLLLSLGLGYRRAWARWATLITFALAGAATGTALVDVANRAFIESTAPMWHVVLPAVLFGLAVTVLAALDRGRVAH
jgi:hypothetical protein